MVLDGRHDGISVYLVRSSAKALKGSSTSELYGSGGDTGVITACFGFDLRRRPSPGIYRLCVRTLSVGTTMYGGGANRLENSTRLCNLKAGEAMPFGFDFGRGSSDAACTTLPTVPIPYRLHTPSRAIY